MVSALNTQVRDIEMAYGPTIGVRQLGALIALLQLHPVDYEKQIHALHLSISAYDTKEAAAEATFVPLVRQSHLVDLGRRPLSSSALPR